MKDSKVSLYIESGKKVILTCLNFTYHAGSQQFVLEMGRFFARNGCYVAILSNDVGGDIARQAQKSGIELISFHNLNWKNDCSKDWDLVVGVHWPLVGALLYMAGSSFRRLILVSLSHFEPLERVWLGLSEANLVIYGNEINLNIQSVTNMNYKNKSTVLLNSLPNEWFIPISEIPPTRRVLIVSNHVTNELYEASIILSRHGFNVETRGVHHIHEDVDLYTIDSACAVISIGRTVQKAMARARPVFIYDRFGGTGWLKESQVESGEQHNFSGRDVGRRCNGTTIAQQFVAGYNEALSNRVSLRRISETRYRLEDNLEKIFVNTYDKNFELRSLNSDHEKSIVLAYWQAFNGAPNVPTSDLMGCQLSRTMHINNIENEAILLNELIVPPIIKFVQELDMINICGVMVLKNGCDLRNILIIRNDGMSWLTNSKMPPDSLQNQFHEINMTSNSYFECQIALRDDTKSFDLWYIFVDGSKILATRINIK